jgi:hypothetical protein
MKKILVIAALALVSFANAQKGTVLVAGNVDFSSTKQIGISKSERFEFSPKVGYQFSNNLTVGLETTISTAKTEVFVAEDKVSTTRLGVFLRYAKPIAGAWSAFADLGVGFQSAKLTPSTGASSRSEGFYTGITPAIAVDLKKSFCLNFSIGGIGFNSLKSDALNSVAVGTFDFNFGKSISIGLSKNF